MNAHVLVISLGSERLPPQVLLYPNEANARREPSQPTSGTSPRLGDPELVAAVLTSLSHIRLAAGDPEGPRDAARLTLAGEELRRREGIPLRQIERDEADDLLRRESAILGPDVMASIKAESSVTDLGASLRLAVAAAELTGG